jgi:RimJ/RimL family protein N-acetyltransferase
VLVEGCEFETERLHAVEWHAFSEEGEGRDTLASVVASMLTEPVTAVLPDRWHGPFTRERAKAWIDERDAEATTLLAVTKLDDIPVGLLVLNETKASQDRGDEIRIGYLLAEEYWGKGFATELVAGLAAWCRSRSGQISLVAGVAHNNLASRRVLEKNGFVLVRAASANRENDTFRLNLVER